MPIIAFCKQGDDGAVRGHSTTTTTEGYPATTFYWTHNTFVGRCLRDREANGYHDSDFYMLVWDDAIEAPREICFASTRGWTYPCIASSVDATDEVKAKYQAWSKQQERDMKARAIRAERKEASELAAQLGITRKRAFRLMLGCALEAWRLDAARKLLTSKLRSEFKLSLRAQVLSWLTADHQSKPSPLSPRQWDAINPYNFRTCYRTGYVRDAMERDRRPVRYTDTADRMMD